MWTKLMSLLVCVGSALAQSESMVVQVEQGPVRGYSDAEGEVFSFLNIPYATAPTGTNKYKAPLPPPVWTEPHDVTTTMIACLQPSYAYNFPPDTNISMKEDCLVANIYVPNTSTANLPVLVYVHGGAYQWSAGFASQFNSLVKTKKVIVVTFNYRLGVPGFLCLGTEDIPGNAGMKDQVALLRWVNRNIARFGGNPEDVTIAGCSAGGGSVDFLTVSRMTTGLFKKAIQDSGAAIGSTGTQADPIANAKLFARHLNFTNVDDFSALVEFYKTASYDLLFSDISFITSRYDASLLFSPCVEVDTGTGEEIFIDDAPWTTLKNGAYNKMPMLYGFSAMEGIYRVPLFDSFKDHMNKKFSDFLTPELHFESEMEKDAVAAEVKRFYFGNLNVSEENILGYVDYFTDIMFAYPMLRTASLRTSLGDTAYLYEYSFVDENTPLIPHTNVRGATHCKQLHAVRDDIDDTVPINHTEEYQAMRQYMREFWLNFITTGNPTQEGSPLPAWPAVNGVLSPFMSLNGTMNLGQSTLLEDRVRFWDSIYEKHYRLPSSPISPGSDSDSAL